MIVGYNQMGLFHNGIHMFLNMVSHGVPPLSSPLYTGRKVHSFIVKLGLSGVVSVVNSLVNMYAKSGDTVMAKIVFDRMRLKDKSSWNTMISMHMQLG
ncbi:putative tetratricopeptide-like helical domain-containing protein [Lupinus albus]|uniref:Putative tetratricopeptide-like helical domain-containing protein n=1 Tax=Lupinus albus TaxID=3870 RepID=A0A6A4QZ00_LUPAL|nr:putative tetratricopeptide-like helical domain-containing protein [Lupinus albus]